MPSPYELRTRWLEWHEFMPDIEALKRQIDTVKREIAGREAVYACVEKYTPPDQAKRIIDMCNRDRPSIDELNEILATLERLEIERLEPGDVIPPAPATG
jgi:hypothetical protein